MIKTLVSVDMDLASGIALRYAYQQANLINMKLQAIHVEKPNSKEKVPAGGWMRNKWEKAILDKGQEEMARLLNTAKLNSSVWGPPKVLIGDREEEIIYELQRGLYDLFIEGILASFDISDFYKLIDSRLYQNMPCPALVVRNLADVRSILLLLSGGPDFRQFISNFLKIFNGAKADLDILHYTFRESGELVFQEKGESDVLRDAESLLTDQGWPPKKTQAVQGTPEQLARYIKDYGLIASSVHRRGAAKTPLLEVLGRVPSPLLLCWQ